MSEQNNLTTQTPPAGAEPPVSAKVYFHKINPRNAPPDSDGKPMRFPHYADDTGTLELDPANPAHVPWIARLNEYADKQQWGVSRTTQQVHEQKKTAPPFINYAMRQVGRLRAFEASRPAGMPTSPSNATPVLVQDAVGRAVALEPALSAVAQATAKFASPSPLDSVGGLTGLTALGGTDERGVDAIGIPSRSSARQIPVPKVNTGPAKKAE